MDTETITLQVPKLIYEQYKQRAKNSHRSIEDELLKVVSEAAPSKDLPPKLAEEIKAMELFSDKALWKAARSRLPATELNQLNYKQQKKGRLVFRKMS